jgi:hypothetical protein
MAGRWFSTRGLDWHRGKSGALHPDAALACGVDGARGRSGRNAAALAAVLCAAVILLSIFYIPAALDFERYRITAWWHRRVAARGRHPSSSAFSRPSTTMLGYFDLACSRAGGRWLLTLAFRDMNKTP